MTQTINYRSFVYINQRLSNHAKHFTFTGKERDSESGFYYFGARYHDADLTTGWLSVDPEIDESPHISAYNYCNSNPVLLKDPDGEFPWVAIGAAVGAAYRAGVAVYEGKSVREVAGAAVKGAIEGALIATPGAGVIANTVGTALGEVAEQFIGSGSVDLENVAVSVVTSTVGSQAGKLVNKGVVKVADKATKRIEQKYASIATKKAIRKEVQSEVKKQERTLGHSTRTQVNKTVSQRTRDLKAYDKKVVQVKMNITNTAVNVGANAVASKASNKFNSQ